MPSTALATPLRVKKYVFKSSTTSSLFKIDPLLSTYIYLCSLYKLIKYGESEDPAMSTEYPPVNSR